uniref:Major facilitator superfamily (MFS) profile domain-containing protein n=1 Tax=Pavo cristatus TaxID=9049 RepID=A0A8C9ELA4_PAVCR
AVCSVGVGGTFQYGYNVSIINAPTQHIHKFLNETWASRYHVELNPNLLTFLWSVIASIFSLGGLCGALIGGSMAIQLGRKGALLMNNVLAILAAILMGISFPTGLFELLIVGRFLIGINSGVGLCVQPLYLGEVAPKHLRGGMAMGSSIFLTGGILTGQVVGLREILGAEAYWPLLLSSSCVPAFAQLLLLPWFPESPRYLLIDRGDELSCAKGNSVVLLSLHLQKVMMSTLGSRFHLSLYQHNIVTGPLIYFYAMYVFEQAGISAEKIPYVTLGTGACECLTALTCGLLIDRVGRRYLILGGYLLMTLWSIVLTFSLTYQDLYSWVPYVSMTSIFAFILSFGLGPGGITNTLTAEIFVQSSRPAACMIGGTVSWISFFTIGMLFPFIVKGLKQYCFVVFLLECSLVAAFIFLVIPETKNKSFLEIKKEFHRLNFGGKSREKETELNERSQLRDEYSSIVTAVTE